MKCEECGSEHDNSIETALSQKTGVVLPDGSYHDWMVGGDHYEVFDCAVLKLLGEATYTAYDVAARLDCALMYRLIPGYPKRVGGIDVSLTFDKKMKR